jgi:hypothetical protein
MYKTLGFEAWGRGRQMVIAQDLMQNPGHIIKVAEM